MSCNQLRNDIIIDTDTQPGTGPSNNNLVSENAGILHVYYQNSYYRSQNKVQFTGLTEFVCKYWDNLYVQISTSLQMMIDFFCSKYWWSFYGL